MKDKQKRILQLGEKVIWWDDCDLNNHRFIVHQLMQYGTMEQVKEGFALFGKKAFVNALENPIPGIFTEKSWDFWNWVLLGRENISMPKRIAVLSSQA